MRRTSITGVWSLGLGRFDSVYVLKKHLPLRGSCTTGSRPPKFGLRLFRKICGQTAGAGSSANRQKLADRTVPRATGIRRHGHTGGNQQMPNYVFNDEKSPPCRPWVRSCYGKRSCATEHHDNQNR
jgi:hypothetical protein